MAKLDNTLPAANANWKDYDAIYYTGGHGVMYDFIDNEHLEMLNRNLFENGRVVSAVCHGHCGLLNTKLSNGEYMIKGRKITGFAWFEEVLAGVAKKVPYNAEQVAKDNGASYSKSFLPFKSYVVCDGNLITGQNPNLAKATAQAVLGRLK